MKKNIFLLLISISLFPITNAADLWESDFYIIPPSENTNIWDIVKEVWSEWWKVIDNYKDAAYWEKDANWNRLWSSMTLWDQLASWIMTRDTLLDYVTYVVRFLLQIWLVVWAWVMIYLWYKKMTEFREFKWWWIKYVVIWVFVIWFAYVIVKTLVSMFIE